MNQLELASAMTTAVAQNRQVGKRIGFVPTMGALHQGHISLIEEAKATCDIVVVSIFVNPTQFNESQDFKSYPRTLSKDLELLALAGVDFVFTPSVEEVYPQNLPTAAFEFGSIASVMEGAHRPGHFNGVAMVVKRLFDIVNPDVAFFGEKDFQQLAIIRDMVKQAKLDISIVGCLIKRESSGLAMSSRNERLTPEQRHKAKLIFETLTWVKNNVNVIELGDLKAEVVNRLSAEPMMELEYVSIANTKTLQETHELVAGESVGMFVAARFGEVRLIDNMILI